MINFKTTKPEAEKIMIIAKRAVKLLKRHKLEGVTLLDIEMDLTACHANGCKLDLDKLLKAQDFEFLHDICGIGENINRQTGKIENQFLPRCARTSKG